MKRTLTIQLLVTGILAGGIGFWLGSRQPFSAGFPSNTAAGVFSRPGTPEGNHGPGSGTADNLLNPALRALLGENGLSDASIRDTTIHVLNESNPARRAAAIGLILESMTPSNASAIRLAFIDSTTRTGRIHDAEWFLMLRRFGEVLGRAAFDEIRTHDSQAATALEGWAMSAPEAALAYLRSQDPSGEGYSGKWMALLSGVALKDPAKSFALALAEPNAPLDAEALVRSAIQSGGVSGATEAMQKALDSAGPDVAQNPAFLRMFHSLTDTMFHQKWISGQSEDMLPWLEQQKGESFLSEDVVNHAAMDAALQGKVTVALDWLDRMNDGGSAGSPGREGLRSAVMRDPSVLANVDETTLDRVIASFPQGSGELTSLAEALEASNPDHARRLRAAGP